jgi:hypothetical protein
MQHGDHSSRSRIAPGLKQPTRGLQRLALSSATHTGRAGPPPPIWPCSTRGFPCPGCCHPGGGLLPHLFTLAKCADRNRQALGFSSGLPPRCKHHRRFIFCGTFRSRAAEALSRLLPRNPLALPGALPYRGRLLRVRHDRSPDFPPARFHSPKRTPASRRSPGSPAPFSIPCVRSCSNREERIATREQHVLTDLAARACAPESSRKVKFRCATRVSRAN